jgi:hypothetical protein
MLDLYSAGPGALQVDIRAQVTKPVATPLRMVFGPSGSTCRITLLTADVESSFQTILQNVLDRSE